MSVMARKWEMGGGRWAQSLGTLCLVALFLIAFCLPVQGAQLLDRVKNQEINQVLRLKVGRSKVLRTPFSLTRISVADPDIADLILISEREIYINALAPGVTNISMWGKSRFTSATVTVEADLTLLKEKLHQILPKEKIEAEAAGDSIVLSGEVSGPVAQSNALGLALLGLAGCYPPSALEMDYGNSVRNNVAQQVVNPNAGFNPKPAVGLPPQAAAGEMEKYDKSFKAEEKKALEMKMGY